MTNFIGEHTCKIDAKGRATFPSAFKKQISDESQDRFIVKKDLDYKCLVLYTIEQWQAQSNELISKTNRFLPEHKRVRREFFKGAAEVQLDSNSRLLIPRRLLDEINNPSEIIMAGQLDQIEIWDKNEYDNMEIDPEESQALVKNILADKGNEH